MTLDLPGGRVPTGATPLDSAPLIVQRELGIATDAIAVLEPLNEQGWIINSSFSNQLLFGVIATINDDAAIDHSLISRSIPSTAHQIVALINDLECLQCRAVLQEWMLRQIMAGVWTIR